jgi:S1/P1 Nuclease
MPLLAWGPEGHRVVANVAAHHLNAVAGRQIRDLLGHDDLASISTWADESKMSAAKAISGTSWTFLGTPTVSRSRAIAPAPLIRAPLICQIGTTAWLMRFLLFNEFFQTATPAALSGPRL